MQNMIDTLQQQKRQLTRPAFGFKGASVCLFKHLLPNPAPNWGLLADISDIWILVGLLEPGGFFETGRISEQVSALDPSWASRRLGLCDRLIGCWWGATPCWRAAPPPCCGNGSLCSCQARSHQFPMPGNEWKGTKADPERDVDGKNPKPT